jgi:hypothetical protein
MRLLLFVLSVGAIVDTLRDIEIKALRRQSRPT